MSETRDTFDDLPILIELRASLGEAFTIGDLRRPANRRQRWMRPSGLATGIRLRSRWLVVAASAAASLAAAGFFGLQGGGVTPSAVAATMDHLAQVAAAQDWTGIPATGQYLYTESHTAHLAAGRVAACQVSYEEIDQIWIATNGSGATRSSYSDVRFASAKAQAACERHGQADPMRVADPNGVGRGTRFPAGGLRFPTNSWKSLSTNPQLLLRQIHRRDGGPNTPAESFTNVADFMRDSDVPPVIRAALYRATALIPGVRSLGIRTTHDAQTGTAVAFYAHGKPTHELIFDQNTGRLLAETYYDDGSHRPDWYDYTAQQIVNAIPHYPLDH